jgi:phosphohistidine phosphatase SixA
MHRVYSSPALAACATTAVFGRDLVLECAAEANERLLPGAARERVASSLEAIGRGAVESRGQR